MTTPNNAYTNGNTITTEVVNDNPDSFIITMTTDDGTVYVECGWEYDGNVITGAMRALACLLRQSSADNTIHILYCNA